MKYTMHLNDGTDIAEISYKPDIGELISIDETNKWFEVIHVNNHQKWCLCRGTSDPRDKR